MRSFFPALLALVFLPSIARTDDSKPLAPDEAAKKVNEQVTMHMFVKSSNLRNDICYLNSESDFKDPKNFTLFIARDGLQKFKQAKIDNPATHFKDKTVRVKGKVTVYRDRPQIVIESPDQITVVSTEKKPGDAG